jgi:hypothetical protein
VTNDPDISQLIKSIERDRKKYDKSTDVMEYLNGDTGNINEKNITPWNIGDSDSLIEDSNSESNHYEEKKHNKARKRY